MSKNHYRRRYAWLAAAIVWMAIIFYFSNQRAAQSGEISGTLTYRMAEGANRLFPFDWSQKTLEEIAEKLEHPVRKAAHMTEYAVLAWILLGNFMQYPPLRKRSFLWAEAGAVFYAATDEFHQLFIEGRSGELKDVAIDGTGAFLGLALAWLALSIYHARRSA